MVFSPSLVCVRVGRPVFVCYRLINNYYNTWQGSPSKLAAHKHHSADQSSVKLPAIKRERNETVKDVGSLVTLLDQALGDSRGSSYPRTTAGEIGWRSADFSKLERFGRHARGQQGIRHLLNWPREAVY